MNEVAVQLPLQAQREGLLEQKFWEFHRVHPEVYEYIVRFARQWRKSRGDGAHLGIKALFERVRWELYVTSLSEKPPPKLNNNHTAFYSRLVMTREPDLVGIFNLRRQRVQSTFGPDNEGLESNEQVISA
tara:strand:+ start:512 stop:901 length:390 start_codon:yes stop_codon:yes gene_type:complete